MLVHQRPILSRPAQSGRTPISSSRAVRARLLKFRLLRPGSMVMQSVTSWELIFSMGKSWKILCHPPTTAMCLTSLVPITSSLIFQRTVLLVCSLNLVELRMI